MAAKLYFDTTVFLNAFEGSPSQAAMLQPIFESARCKPHRVVTSTLALAELFGKESPKGWAWQTRFYLDLIVGGAFIELIEVSREILLQTGHHRRAARASGRSVKLADAIHVVTAIRSDCRYIITSDRRFFVPEPLTLIIADVTGLARVTAMFDA